MRIKKLELKAFRSFTGIDLDLNSARVLIGGVNEAGKSSVREAIRWALTGKAKNHDGSTLETKDLEPGASAKAGNGVSVSAAIDPLGTVTRSWGAGGSSLQVEGFKGTPNGQQQALFDKLGTTEEFLHAILDTSAFLRLHHAEAKALVLGLLNVQVSIDGTVYTLDGLDAAYKQAFDDRRLSKQKLKTLAIPAKPEGQFPAMAAVEDRLAALRIELETLNQLIGTTAGQRRQIQNQLAGIVAFPVYAGTGQDELTVKIADLEERLAIMEAEAVPEETEPVPIPSNKPTHDVTLLRSRAEALMSHKPTKGCVLDSGIKCPVHGLKFTNRGKDIIAEIEKQAPQNVDTKPEVTKNVNPLTAVRKELDELKRQQAGYEQAEAQNKTRQAERDRLTAELSSLPDTSEQEAKIAETKERIQKGEGIRKQASDHQSSLRLYELAVKAHDAQLADVARLEALCETLGPSGARVKALEAALDPFLAAINGFTAAFGWVVSIQVEPWSVIVNGRPVETYSKSAQYRIGIALQIAIAKLSGLNFACIDELDMLDAKNREIVGGMLLKSDLEQVIILGTREPTSPLPKDVPGMLCYRIGQIDGRSTILETTGA